MIRKLNLTDKKGVIVSDAILSILIIILFAGIIISLITNIVLETRVIKINSQEMDYMTEILEYVDKISYDDVTQAEIIQYVNNKNFDGVSAGTDINELTTPYKIGVEVVKYNTTSGNTGKLDLIKIVTIEIKYTLNNKDYTLRTEKSRVRTSQEIQELINQ